MGNAKSRNSLHKVDKEISRNKTKTQLTKTTTTKEKDNQKVASGTTTTTTTTITTVGGPLLVEVKNNKNNATATTTRTAEYNKAIENPQQIQNHQHQLNQRQQKAADNSVNIITTEQQQQQRLKQGSLWSLGSLNWNFSYSARNSYKQRQKLSRKSFSTLQYQHNKRSKTQWHKPLTNAIFSSHFKESSRNEEFHIDQLVAKGAFGVVFKVIDKQHYGKEQPQQQQQQKQKQQPQLITDNRSTPTVYALKVLKKSKIISDNSLQQIKDEADIQKLCGHHPFIVKQFDLWQNRHNLHILSEYIPNGELFSTIGSFSLNLIRLYLAEIALALDFLHNAGIIYRDVKPENILLTTNYHLKLTDFGLSKWLKLGLTTKTMCGTFQYMAPEILRGEPYTHAVDWWSLGVIVCQMFINKSPDIRQFITIKLPEHLQSQNDSVDNMKRHSDVFTEELKSQAVSNFLPPEVNTLTHEAKDVVQRLLEVDAYARIRSVRSLQRIAMYMHFKIESEYCLKICPLDIIRNDHITIYDKHLSIENSTDATNAFKGF